MAIENENIDNDDLNERTVHDFLTYANSVIKSRAIPFAEDNLKPIHRKILYTLYEEKATPEKEYKRCATLAGAAIKYSPHGDASIYGAMVRLAQWWKIRYPLLEFHGNCGNVLGDPSAASRYTSCRLSKIGMLMLEGLDKNAVDFKLNYDGSCQEPTLLPSKFPYILCGNNSGIAVGMSSDIVSHNFTEVAAAIKYYLDNKDCTTRDLMQFIKGPDFPTGGRIINGDDLLEIYSTGRGAVKIQPHYDVVNHGKETVLVFHDLPYGVEIDNGVKAPLKKLVIEEGYEQFQNFDVKKVGPHNFDILITLAKGANVAQCIDILLTKTRLSDSVKINQTFIVNGEPRVLNLKQMIEYWVNYRSSIISRIAKNDYEKTNHKLTIVLGLQKCMSDIDAVVQLIRNADNRAAAKRDLMAKFELNDEQADAVLDMKLSRLSRLDLSELNDSEKELKDTLAKLNNVLTDEKVRYDMIKKDLDDIKKVVGEDKRLTEIVHYNPENIASEEEKKMLVKKLWYIYPNGIRPLEMVNAKGDNLPATDLIDVAMAYSPKDIYVYEKGGTFGPVQDTVMNIGGAFVYDSQKHTKLVAVTKNGNIKMSSLSEYKLNHKAERAIKVKDGDELVFTSTCSDDDFLFLSNGDNVLKLAIKDLPVASKATIGVKSGFTTIVNAFVAANEMTLLSITKDNKGKFVAAADFNVDKRGNKGQSIAEGTIVFKPFIDGREVFYGIPKNGKVSIAIPKSKISLKSKTAIGAAISNRVLTNII